MKHKRLKVILVLCCCALLIGGIRAFFGGERLLLEHTVKLCLRDQKDKSGNSVSEEGTSDEADFYAWGRGWISDSEVVELRDIPTPSSTLCSIVRHNLCNGAVTSKSVPFGEQLEKRYSNPCFSPDGQWLMWHSFKGEDTVRACNVATGQSVRWRVEEGDYRHFENHWLADNHHWLEYTTVPQHVTLHDVQHPQTNIRMTLPPLQSGHSIYEEYDDCLLTTQDRLVTCDEDINGQSGGAITFQEFALQPEQGKVVRLNTFHNRLPLGLRHIRHAVSSDGSRILWQVQGIPTSPLQHWLTSKLPKPPPRKQTWVGWINFSSEDLAQGTRSLTPGA